VLEVGCGGGDLARELEAAGYDVVAIDPVAPAGAIFRAVRLEDFDGSGPFDAVVASLSLHHIDHLAPAVDKIAGLLRAGGLLVLSEWDRDRFRDTTARWYFHQRKALAALGREHADIEPTFEEWWQGWVERHGEIHPYAAMRSELDRRFSERYFEWVPYLYGYRLGGEVEPLERALIESGEIEAVGFRYVGELTAGFGSGSIARSARAISSSGNSKSSSLPAR
jgi:SAM-dependent methyltransferase